MGLSNPILNFIFLSQILIKTGANICNSSEHKAQNKRSKLQSIKVSVRADHPTAVI